MHAKYFPAYLPIPKYRVGVLQIFNLKNDPLLENVVNDFSEQGNMTPPPPLATLSYSGLVVRGSQYGVWIFFLIRHSVILIFMMFTAGFEPTYVTEVQVKGFHSLLAVGAMDVRVPLYLGHS